MRSHLFFFPCVFSLGFLAGYQWAWLSEITFDGLLSSSSKEELPLNLMNMMQAARLAMGTLQEAIVLLLWANLTLLILLVPLLFTAVALLVAILALFSKVRAALHCNYYWQTFPQVHFAWDADFMKRRYQDFRRGLNIIIYGGHRDD